MRKCLFHTERIVDSNYASRAVWRHIWKFTHHKPLKTLHVFRAKAILRWDFKAWKMKNNPSKLSTWPDLLVCMQSNTATSIQMVTTDWPN